MKIYYSPKTKGFYDTNFPYSSLPEDIIEVTPEQHQTLLNELNTKGKEIYIEAGLIKLRTPAVTLTWDNIRSQRNSLLAKSDYTQMPDWPGNREAWAAYRQSLRDITQRFNDPSLVVWPSTPN